MQLKNTLLILIIDVNCMVTNSIFANTAVTAKIEDFGTKGQIFIIKERSMLELILEKLNQAKETGKILELQEQFADKVMQKIKSPSSVLTKKRTGGDRVFYYDPSLTQKTDIKDHKGNVIVQAGTTVNPLDKISWGEPLIFIDGSDKEQVEFAMQYTGRGKITLTRGSPIDLGNEYKQTFFYDQDGLLIDRFKIESLPAIIEQEGRTLKITEIDMSELKHAQ